MRLKKMTTLLLAGVMAVGMIVGTAGSARAEDNGDAGAQTYDSAPGEDPKTSKGDADDQTNATVKITKNLFMDANVTTPDNYLFYFTTTPVSVDGVDYVSTATKGQSGYMPNITIGNIASNGTPAATKYTTDGTNFSDTKPAAGQKVVTYTTGDILSTFIANVDHAGEYIYTVTESSFDESGTSKTADTDAMEKSDAVYTMHIYVANTYEDTTATPPVYANPNGLYIAAVGVYKTTDDAGATDGDKVNANDGKGITGAGSEYAFKNVYTPVSSLRIEKEVKGAYADLTKKFSFTTKLELPAISKKSDDYEATVYNADKSIDTTQGTAGVIKFSKTDYQATYTLKDGQYLQFEKNLPVGTTYTAVETVPTGYTLTGTVITADGTNKVPDKVAASVTAGAINTTNTVGDTTLLSTDDEPIGNHTVATNTYKEVTPTGILINNLPFILMILVAIGGVVAYMTLKRRHAVR